MLSEPCEPLHRHRPALLQVLRLVRSVHRSLLESGRTSLERWSLSAPVCGGSPACCCCYAHRRRRAATSVWPRYSRARAATSSCDSRSCVRFSRSLRNLPCLPRREAKVAPTTWRPEMHPSTRYGTTWRGTFGRPSPSALTAADADCVTSGPLGNCSWQVNPSDHEHVLGELLADSFVRWALRAPKSRPRFANSSVSIILDQSC